MAAHDPIRSFYTSVWLFAAIWYPFCRRIKPRPWWRFVLLLLPILLDGSTHAVSDFAGLGQGFRDTNAWLIATTNNGFPAGFYAGDALGSFHSMMRFLTGVLAGLGIVWLSFPFFFKSQV